MDNIEVQRIGSTLKTLRKTEKYTQGQVAEYLGVDQSLISKIEGGDRGLSASMLKKLAQLYCVPVSELINGSVTTEKCMAFRTDELGFEDVCDLAEVNKIIINQMEMDRMVHDEK